MALKDQIQSDTDIFFNPDEFGELHDIDGRQLLIVVDNDRLSKRTQREYDEIYVGDLLYFVKATDYGSRPKPNSVQLFDKRPYEIFDIRENMGMYEIILKGSET